jgi:hypothetical protein
MVQEVLVFVVKTVLLIYIVCVPFFEPSHMARLDVVPIKVAMATAVLAFLWLDPTIAILLAICFLLTILKGQSYIAEQEKTEQPRKLPPIQGETEPAETTKVKVAQPPPVVITEPPMSDHHPEIIYEPETPMPNPPKPVIKEIAPTSTPKFASINRQPNEPPQLEMAQKAIAKYDTDMLLHKASADGIIPQNKDKYLNPLGIQMNIQGIENDIVGFNWIELD